MTDEVQRPLPMGLQLQDGEVIVHRTRAFFRWWYWIAGLVILAIPAALRRITTDYVVVTNRRVIATSGVLIRSQKILPMEKVQNVSLKQGPIASLLGYGDAMVETAGERSAERIKLVDGPREFRDAVLNQLQK